MTAAVKDTILYCIYLLTIPPMAHNYQSYHYVPNSPNTERSKPTNKTNATQHTRIGQSHTFLQLIQITSSNRPLSVETNAFLDCLSDTTLFRKDITKILNLEGSQQQLTVTSALSKSSIDSAIISVNTSSSAMKDS